MSDQETMVSFVKRLRRHHALILGDVTRQYPVIIRVKELKGIRTAGETQYFFKPKGARAAGASNTPAPATPTAAPVQTTPGKPTSPIEKEPAARKSSPRQTPATTPPASRPSTEEEVAVLKRLQELWQTIVAEVRDKSELLGSVLISGNPARFQDHVVYIGFSSRDSFHRDLLQEPEYRDVVERAISETLKRPVIIACFTTDTRGRPRR
jgi:hypothetical protein